MAKCLIADKLSSLKLIQTVKIKALKTDCTTGESQTTEKLKIDFRSVSYNRLVCPSPVSL